MSDPLHDLIEHLARSLVDRPDDVRVRNVGTEEAPLFELRVAREDLGKVIGRQGSTARAIRTVLMAAASKARSRVVLNIVEE